MEITVALDGEKKRDLRFFAGDDMSLTIVVYAHDGDITPITVSNVRFAAADGSLPMDAEFVVPSNFFGRVPYRIVGEVEDITTTLAYGVMQTAGGWPSLFCWCSGPGPYGIVGKSDNITVLDAHQNFDGIVSVEGALQQLGDFKKATGDIPGLVDTAVQAASDAEAAAQEAVDTLDSTVKKPDLAATDGATTVGTPEGTVQDALDGRPTKAELAGDDGAGLVKQTLPYATAILRGQDARNAEFVSLSDFGVPSDAAAAFQKAFAELTPQGQHLFLPALDGGLRYQVGEEVVWPTGMMVTGRGRQSRIELDGCAMAIRGVHWVGARDLVFTRIGVPGPALVCEGAAEGMYRSFFDSVHIDGSTGSGAVFSGGWLFSWFNPYITECETLGLVTEEGAFATGMNSMSLFGGEIQSNTVGGIVLDRCKQFNLFGTCIEGNGFGIGIGKSAASVNIQAYFEENYGGHIVPYSHEGGLSGFAQCVVVQSGSYMLRGANGAGDNAINVPNCRNFIVEDGVFIQGYAGVTTPMVKIKDAADSNRAVGYIGNITTDAPPTLTLLNECAFFGKEQRRSFHVGQALSDSAVTLFKLPVWLGAGAKEKRNPSNTMEVVMHVDVTTAGVGALSARARDSAGVVVGAQVNGAPNLAVGYNRFSLTLADSENVAYVEVLRSGAEPADTVVGVNLLSVDVVTHENRVKSV